MKNVSRKHVGLNTEVQTFLHKSKGSAALAASIKRLGGIGRLLSSRRGDLRKLLLLLSGFVLAACSRGSGDAGMCLNGQATFGDGKVQLARRAPSAESTLLNAEIGVETIDKLTLPDQEDLEPTTELTVVLKNKCESPGKIANA